jgi:hypothetical protein
MNFTTNEYLFSRTPIKYLKKPNKSSSLDTYYGIISYYNWLKDPVEKGLRFRTILYNLDNLKSKYTNEVKLIDIIKRRIALTEILEEDMKYLSQRFIWKEIENIDEIFIYKFENFMEQITELFLLIINFYIKNTKSPLKELDNFGGIINEFFKKDRNINRLWYEGYHSLNFSFYIYIRNMIVHHPEEIEYNYKNGDIKIKIENLPRDRRYGLYHEYLKDVLNRYRGKKTPNSFLSKPVIDPTTKFLIKLKLNKNCNPIDEDTIISYDEKILKLVEMIKGDLFRLTNDLLFFL